MKKLLTLITVISLTFLAGCDFNQDERDNLSDQESQDLDYDTNEERDVLDESDGFLNEQSQSYIEVNELGFKIPVEEDMAEDLSYEIDKLSDRAEFASQALSTANENCGYGSIGMISKIEGTPADPGVEDISGYYQGVPTKQFNGYFLAFTSPQDSCTGGIHGEPGEFALEQKAFEVLKKGFENIVLI